MSSTNNKPATRDDDLLTARQISEQYHVDYVVATNSMGHPPLYKHLVTRTWPFTQYLVPRSVISWRPREPESRREPTGGRVYFIQHATGGLIKIGVSMSPRHRLKGINATTHDPRYKILKTERGGNNREGMLHRQFAHLREHGEWFRPEADLLDYIEWLGYVG